MLPVRRLYDDVGVIPHIGLVLIKYLDEIVIGLMVPVASIRVARTNRFSEAFNFSAVLDYIRKIGWIISIIAFIIIILTLAPLFAVFQARSMTRV